MYSRTYFERKAKEDEIGPTDWSNAAKSEVQCPKEGCDGNEAAFFQVQIRSADEPMTTFFKVSCCCFSCPCVSCLFRYLVFRAWVDADGWQCMTCGGRWRD